LEKGSHCFSEETEGSGEAPVEFTVGHRCSRRLKPDHRIWSLLPHFDKELKASLLKVFFMQYIPEYFGSEYKMLKCMLLSSTHSLIKKEQMSEPLSAVMSGPLNLKQV